MNERTRFECTYLLRDERRVQFYPTTMPRYEDYAL